MPKTTTCAYCHTVNPREEDRCIACGTPLDVASPPPPSVMLAPMAAAGNKSSNIILDKPSPEVKKAAEMADQVYHAAALTYYIFWRTVSEALAISVTAFALGLISATTDMRIAGVVGAVLVGLVVGLTSKLTWLVALSAPLGLLAGCVIWICPWAAGLGLQGMVFTGTVAAMIAARLGAQNVRHTWWDWVRPFFAMFGALLFALLGLAIGAGMKWLVGSG